MQTKTEHVVTRERKKIVKYSLVTGVQAKWWEECVTVFSVSGRRVVETGRLEEINRARVTADGLQME